MMKIKWYLVPVCCLPVFLLGRGQPVIPVTILLTALSCWLIVIFFFKTGGKIPASQNPQDITRAELHWIFLGTAFLLRISLAGLIEGYPSDINCFRGWALIAAGKGLPGFYLAGSFVDYPPGYIYILYLLGLLQKIFAIPPYSGLFLVLIKLPAIIADILAALLIYRLAREKLDKTTANMLSILYALNPAVIFDSAIYGQVDGVFVLFLLWALVYLSKNKLEWASVLFVITALVKPQALLFAPLLLFAIFYRLRGESGIRRGCKFNFISVWRHSLAIIRSALAAAIALVVLILPFSIKQDPLWIIRLYKNTLSSYPYTTLNAANLFAFLGANWVPESEPFIIFSYRTWGYGFIFVIVGAAAWLYFTISKRGYPGASLENAGTPATGSLAGARIFYLGLFMMAGIYILSTRMHERYIFPVLALALLSYVYTKDKRLLVIFGGFSLTFLVNVGQVLFWVVEGGKSAIPSDNLLLRMLALLNMALLAYIVTTGYSLFLKKTRERN